MSPAPTTPYNGEPWGGLATILESPIVIIFSEIGDKAFLIAAILAMRHSGFGVLAGALGSLVVMSILSTAMGYSLPTLIPKDWTQLAASFLFLFFVLKMARQMKGRSDKIKEEMKEAEEKIQEDNAESDEKGLTVIKMTEALA